jgi:diaminopimelate epimerase
MKTIRFTKAHGAQNDFVIVDDRDQSLTDDERRSFAIWSAHRRKGIGSDGSIFIDRSGLSDFTMAFYNPDGSVGSMCGNGGRCAALFAQQNGIAGGSMRFDVLGKIYQAEVDGGIVRLAFPPPERITLGIELECDGMSCVVDYIDTGAPHIVLFADQLPAALRAPLDTVDIEHIGAMLRRHPGFSPRGANVNVLERREDGIVAIRTFEKGVEAETEACGTGTLAAGMIAHVRRDCAPPVRLRTHGGDLLTVHFTPGETAGDDPAYYARDLILEGPAALVYDGCCVLPTV